MTDRRPWNARYWPVSGVTELSAIEASGAMAGSAESDLQIVINIARV